MYVKI